MKKRSQTTAVELDAAKLLGFNTAATPAMVGGKKLAQLRAMIGVKVGGKIT